MRTIKSLRQMYDLRNVLSCSLYTNPNNVTLAKTFASHSLSIAWHSKGVIPDVIDDLPTVKLVVQYPEVNINEGTTVDPKQVKDQPSVCWAVKYGDLFALCMVDPDAPSRSKPSQGQWQHWIVVNIPGNIVEKGETLTEYIGAVPPKGTDLHRYVFLLYTYPKKINFTEKKLLKTSAEGRAKFSVRKFAEKYKLGKPLAGNFFMTGYDDYVPELYHQLGLNSRI